MSAAGSGGQLDIGGVFDATTAIYKRSFATFWIVALILMVPAGIIVGFLSHGILGIIASLINLAAVAWLAGAVIKIVQDVEDDGQVDQSVGELLGSVWPILLPIIGLEILVSIGVGIGLFLLIVPGVILALIWAVAVPALVIENTGVFGAFSRSSDLTRDNRMRILGIGILVVVLYVVVFALAAILAAASPILGAIAAIVLGVLIYPYVSIITAVLYFRLVELKEGVAGAINDVVVEENVVVDEGPVNPPPAV